MIDREKVIKALEDFNKNRICLPHLIPWDEITDALALLKEQQQYIWELQDQVEYLTDKLKEREAEIRQLRLALDIVKGTCKGIVVETDEKYMGDL